MADCSAASVFCGGSLVGGCIGKRSRERTIRPSSSIVCSAINKSSPKGFGQKESATQNALTRTAAPADERKDSAAGIREEEDDTVPEIVTNRMLRRMAFTVGIPLGIGLLAFPVYYYLKMIVKLDVPEWLPVITSFLTFGTSGFGILYAVVSSSWDPQREGSVLGLNEARVNWGIVWEKRPDPEDD